MLWNDQCIAVVGFLLEFPTQQTTATAVQSFFNDHWFSSHPRVVDLTTLMMLRLVNTVVKFKFSVIKLQILMIDINTVL